MKPNRSMRHRWLLSAIYILIGVTLIVCGRLGLTDDYWSGMGVALTAVGALQLFRIARYKTDPQYKETADTAANDERNHFIRGKAWSWVGYLYVLIAAVATIVFKLLEQELLMYAASGSVCLILVLYWIVYLILRKKY